MKKTLLFALVPFLSGCGLLFVHGPPPNWQEIQDLDQLETMALTQPCTTGKGILLIDALFGGTYGIMGGLILAESTGGGRLAQEEQYMGLVSLGLATPFVLGIFMGNAKANDCRAFNARVLRLRRGGASNVASHEWLDELFPLPDLDVTGLDPVFGVPINQDQ